jgi:hypothetical protein
VQNRPDPVQIINGRMAQFGWHWMQCKDWPEDLFNEAARMCCDEDLIYCIDAPTRMPAGGCKPDDYGLDLSTQIEVRRP